VKASLICCTLAVALAMCLPATWAQSPPPGQTGPAMLPPRSGKPAAPAASQPAPTGPGKLTIQLVQGTKDGPPLGAQNVTVVLLHRDAAVRADQVAIDDKGHGQLEHLPVMPPVRPKIIVTHGGIEENGIGGTLDTNNLSITMTMTVYETTDQAPAWSIASRHVLVKTVPEGLQVTEMFDTHNPTDRVWIGQREGGPVPVTLAYPIPTNATKLTMGIGWHPGLTRMVEGRLMNLMPMFPGDKRYAVGYIVPVKDGQTSFTLTAPAPEGQFLVVLPNDGSVAKAEGLQDLGIIETGPGPEGKCHAFQAPAAVKTGQTATITVSGIVLPPPTTRPATQPASQPAREPMPAK